MQQMVYQAFQDHQDQWVKLMCVCVCVATVYEESLKRETFHVT